MQSDKKQARQVAGPDTDRDGLRIEGLTKVFRSGKTAPGGGAETDGTVRAVDDLSLHISEGEFVVLLGPSGCGKTTLLRCLAGLETPTAGTIAFGDRLLFDATSGATVPTYQRRLGMVFQTYSLWPHMTVSQNVAYPLRVRRDGDRDERSRRVNQTLELLECGELAERYPAQLSGGQQQRIALARALVAEPDLLLFDEPLSNLDFRLRGQLRTELAELHERLGFTAVYVTHDQTEAFQLGTRVAVMNHGRIEQVAPPEQVYSEPASPYVANFLGIENRIPIVRSEGGWKFEGGAIDGTLPALEEVGAEFEIHLRGADLHMARPGGATVEELGGVSVGEGEVVSRTYTGGHFERVVRVGDLLLNSVVEPEDHRYARGDRVVLGFNPRRALIYGPLDNGDRGLVRLEGI